ncbi:MAG: hypothetical protein ABSD47_20930 [Candidatus Methylomirabilota bacterium]|jgi:hypothetical protein
MAFLVFECVVQGGRGVLRPAGQHFQLGGYQLIYQAWDKRGRPTDQGWHVSADELIALHTNGKESYKTRRLVIDFDPRATWRIGLVELLHVYAYTYGGGKPGEAAWTPLMLRLRDVFYIERNITPDQKTRIIAKISEPTRDDHFIEFLYLGGATGWNWGRNGSTNAVFIKPDAREYFQKFF